VILVLETLTSLASRGFPFSGVLEGLEDLLARAGRLAALGLPGFAAILLVGRLRPLRQSLISDTFDRALAWLCAPVRAAALALVGIASTAVFALTAARAYDLPWHMGALFAVAPLAVATVAAATIPALRRHPGRVGAPHVFGRMIWTTMAAVLGFVVLPVFSWGELGEAFVVVALWAFVPVPMFTRASALTRTIAAAGVVAAGLGFVIDARVPALRRYLSVHTPVSGLGTSLLQRASDLDGDGSAGALGLDCDDLDPDRSPVLDDLPDDGIDQNCTGRDGSLRRTLDRRNRSVPQPPQGAIEPAADVVLVTVDALRQDAIFPRSGRSLMPGTAAWLESRCIRLTGARANATFTDLSVLSLMTGTQPRHSRRGHELIGAPGDEAAGRRSVPPTLASAFKTAGYQTMAVVAIDVLQPYLRFGLEEVEVLDRARGRDVDAPTTLDRARRALARRDGRRPLFLWVHLFDTHAPYAGGTGRSDYDRAAAAMDGPLASFLAALPAGAVIALTSDHGEAFGEHGEFFHGNGVYEEEVRVPLAMCAPGDAWLGQPRADSTPVELVDVAPTLLELTGVDAPYPGHGESLVPLLRQGTPPRTPWVVMEVWIPTNHVQGIVLDDWKWVRDLDRGWEATFDLEADPAELRDLSTTHPEVRSRLRGLFFELLDDELDSFRSWRIGGPGSVFDSARRSE
jgi:predicted secreted protein